MNLIQKEKQVVESMIRLYCQKYENNQTLCPECAELIRYAHQRLDQCQYKERKGSCKRCTTHCYRPVMRNRIRIVMRFSGPRMLIYHPWTTIKHWL